MSEAKKRPRIRTVLKCLVISPGDVAKEREAVAYGILDFNARFGEVFEVSVEPVRWETHGTPAMGAPAQTILNEQVVHGCDLAVAVFWTRLGTPTDSHPSGSAEEIARLRSQGVPVSVFFSDKPAEPSRIDAEQFAKLRRLREQYQAEGLLGTFESVEELRRLIPGVLAQHVAALRRNEETAGTARAGYVSAPLPDVRVTIDVVDMLAPRPEVAPALDVKSPTTFVRIRVENHSPASVFLTGPSFGVRAGGRVVSERDSTGTLAAAKRELRSGDSTDYLYRVTTLEEILGDAPPGDVIVHDAIQRRFRAPDDALALAMAAARAKARPVPNTFAEWTQRELTEARAALAQCEATDDNVERERLAIAGFDRLQAFMLTARGKALDSGETSLVKAYPYEDEGGRLLDAFVAQVRRSRLRRSPADGDLGPLFLEFGPPDSDDSTFKDDPRPPIVTRWIEYGPERVRATFGLDPPGGTDGQRWTLIGFQDTRSTDPITAVEARRRLAGRVGARRDSSV